MAKKKSPGAGDAGTKQSVSNEQDTNSLTTLAQQINEAHRHAYRLAGDALQHAAQCGRLLIKAKRQLQHGEWLPWLSHNTGVTTRQSQKYMRLAEHWPRVEMRSQTSLLTIDSALESLEVAATPSRAKLAKLLTPKVKAYDSETGKVRTVPVGVPLVRTDSGKLVAKPDNVVQLGGQIVTTPNDQLVTCRWRRTDTVTVIAKAILGTLKHQPHDHDISRLQDVLRQLISETADKPVVLQ